MINLIAISYTNIGPFKDSPISLFFEQGKYLIKAAIGTGKSFLFFDGPIYALYKASKRNILNNQSKEGTIKLIFEHDGETRYIVRNLSKAKSKESCSSKLYKLSSPSLKERGLGGEDRYNNEKVSEDNNIFSTTDIIPSLLTGVEMEEIVFKNETDLQQTFQNILPPKEVFLNTVFLMQDSDNIFELLPSERLNVLKNVFGLLGIDEAKDIITEKRKEVGYKLKAYSETSKYDEKIKQFIIQYTTQLKHQEELIKTIERDVSEGLFASREREELEMIQDKITINDLDEKNFSIGNSGEIDTIIQDKKNTYITLQQQVLEKEKELKKIQFNIDEQRQEIISIQKKNEELDKNIKDLNPEILITLKQKKQTIITQQNEEETKIPKIAIQKFLKEEEEICKDFPEIEKEVSITTAYLLINYLTSTGKSLNDEIQNLQLQQKNIELQKKHEEEIKTTAVKNIENEITTREQQLLQQQNQLQNFLKSIDEQATFSCEKIGTNCPFIKVINKKHFDQQDLQKQVLEEHIRTTQEKIKNLKIRKEENIANNIPLSEGEGLGVRKYTISSQIPLLENQKSKIKDFFQEIKRTEIQNSYQVYTKLIKEKEDIDKQILIQEQHQQQADHYKQELESNKGKIISIQEQCAKQEKNKETLKHIREQEKQQREHIPYQTILAAEQTSNQIKVIQRDITTLIGEYKTIKIEISALQIQEKQLNNLYTIFSKELLLLVLQDHLPILNDIVNSYLAQIVDYQINLSLNKSNTDKLELEANIVDALGEREIKSLSGGQKIILKLVWMLALSSYTNSPILFLDETINNLDIETVSKVADMIEDFVKQKHMKFYTVTHNQQIQDMNIWDKTIEISRS